MAFLETSDGVLYYRLSGKPDAPALVLVNSLGTECRIWDDVISILGANYSILSYDLRGHGLSSVPCGPYSVDSHLADLTALVDHVGFSRFALAGVSIGGLISQGFAQRHAERLTALVLSNTAAKIGDAEFWDQRIETVRASGVSAIADGIMQRWFSPHFQQTSASAWSAWRAQFLRNDTEGYAATCATLRDTDLTGALAQTLLPVLVVAGADDLATPPSLVEATAKTIPGAAYELLDQVGHLPSLEAPARFSQLTLAFLERVGHV